MACNGSSQAMSVTKSPTPPVRADSTIRRARASRASRSPAMARTEKPRETMPRSFVCSGGSWLSMMSRCTSSCSLVMSEPNRMIAVLA